MFRVLAAATIVLVVAFGPHVASAADWATWRHDAARSNATPAALPDQLHLQWIRHLPAPRPAWPASQTKLQYDAVYQPIVTGRLMFVGSTVNDSVTAYDTRSGKQVWRFYTDGPIRFAPAAGGGRVYAASDDGFLYCLDADSGDLLWKFNGGPEQRRIIGNGRLVSSWPIRGGPVIADGAVYFTASIWPFMGVFIHAVDAETGERLWTNSETGSRWVVHPHGAPSFGSIVPQGYLAVTGNHLIVPGGRSLPAVLDRTTGELMHFQFGGKGAGGWDVAAHERFYVIRGAAFSVSDGTSIGAASSNVLTDTLMIGPATASSLDGAVRETDVDDRKGQKVRREKIAPQQSWTVTTDGLRVFAMCGNQIFAGGDGVVARYGIDAARVAGKPQPPGWTAKIDGKVAAVLGADERLFVVTDQAAIYCFGGEAVEASTYEVVTVASERPAQWAPPAKRLLDAAGTTEGYALALGIHSGRLIEQILDQSDMRVIVLDPDAAAVESFRRRVDASGSYGTRVDAHVGSLPSFHLPPYLFNLVFSEDVKSVHKPDKPTDFIQSLYRVLRPYGGTAAFESWDSDYAVLSDVIDQAKPPAVEFGEIDGLKVFRRRGALPGAGSWTHQYADAANTVVSKDQLVRAPLGLLWFGGPSNDRVLPRHGHGPSPQVAGGRLVIEGADMLRCVDVYTGRVLWEKELPGLGKYYNITGHFPGAGEIGSNYVTTPEAVYVVYGNALLDLDAATGETRREFRLSDDGGQNPRWGFLASDGDLLVATASPVAVQGAATVPSSTTLVVPRDMTSVIPRAAEWQYLAGSDPAGNWASAGYKDVRSWKTGRAGFGYGDKDDRTVLSNMRSRYGRAYIRTTFDGKLAVRATRLALGVRYDDAFIAYLNGREVVRAGVGKGSGLSASGISSHEAGGVELFEIKEFRELLRPGENILAIEGHNVSIDSSDFTLDPILLVDGKNTATDPEPKKESQTAEHPLAAALTAAPYSSGSRRLVVFDRHTGKMLWQRSAEFNFRHNCIVVAAGKIFCIDSMSAAKRQVLARRGIQPTAKPRLLALDATSGGEIWSTDRDVFGTFLNYAPDHDVLLQAGSAYRDRARDESGRGMVAYRGTDGKVLWQDLTRSYSGPCLLWRDKIITNGSGGFQLDLLTGKPTGWSYRRMYGCNTAVGSEHLLTFRSGAAGYCDISGDSGTGNIGGFRSSCTANLIAADGVLNAPDYTRTCSCAYQNQSSLALVHMPAAEMWTFSNLSAAPQRFGINLGGPGDRRASDGIAWFDVPSIGGSSPELPVAVTGEKLRFVRHHASRVHASGEGHLPWVAASCVIGVQSIQHEMAASDVDDGRRSIRLHFAELENRRVGERVFHVSLNGTRVLENFDIAAAAGGPLRAITKQFPVDRRAAKIDLDFDPVKGVPCISGLEVVPQK